MAIIQVTVTRPPHPPQNNGRNGICTPPKHFTIPCSCCCGCDGNVSRTGVRYIIRWPAAVHGTRSQLCSTTPPPLGSSHFAIYMTLCSCTTLPPYSRRAAHLNGTGAPLLPLVILALVISHFYTTTHTQHRKSSAPSMAHFRTSHFPLYQSWLALTRTKVSFD